MRGEERGGEGRRGEERGGEGRRGEEWGGEGLTHKACPHHPRSS